MKTPTGCKLIGAQQALAGIGDAVVLFHSVVGCNFGTLGLHVPNAMDDIRQTCSVISDEDIIFGGEALLEKALLSAAELYRPRIIFLLSGCVSEIVHDDVASVVQRANLDIPVLHLPAAGFCGDFSCGYEEGSLLLLKGMEAAGEPDHLPTVNLLGFGADDYRAKADCAAIQELLGESVRCRALNLCTWNGLSQAGSASLNLVLGRGVLLAKAMEERFSVPYEAIDYPYGATGARKLLETVGKYVELPHSRESPCISAKIAKALQPVYSYLQALYGMPAAVLAEGGRAEGMRRFLKQELGMDVTVFAKREELSDLEEFYNQMRQSEVAMLFASSFEQEICDELELPLIRFDYPVFDEIALSGNPFVGERGTVNLVEQIINSVMRARRLSGGLYQ